AAFVGVQPKLTHEPPSRARSASATLWPRAASACASGLPAWPPPMINTSKRSLPATRPPSRVAASHVARGVRRRRRDDAVPDDNDPRHDVPDLDPGRAGQGPWSAMASNPRAGGVEVVELRKRFGAVTVVDVPRLAVAPRTTLVLVGPSGCGKSTLLRLVVG